MPPKKGDRYVKNAGNTCAVEGCPQFAYAKTYCRRHYRRLIEMGDPGPACKMHEVVSAEERFLSKVNQGGDIPGCAPHLGRCWEWLAAKDKKGYGRFGVGQDMMLAHRWSYEHHVGSIPAGLTLDHLCRNPSCVNPFHLEPVSSAENSRRSPVLGKWKRPDVCKRGHPLSGDNLYLYLRKDGATARLCRECRREAKNFSQRRLRMQRKVGD